RPTAQLTPTQNPGRPPRQSTDVDAGAQSTRSDVVDKLQAALISSSGASAARWRGAGHRIRREVAAACAWPRLVRLAATTIWRGAVVRASRRWPAWPAINRRVSAAARG